MKDGRLKGSAAVAIAKLSQDQQKAALAKAPKDKKISAPKSNGFKRASVETAAKRLVKSITTEEIEATGNNWIAVERKLFVALAKAVNYDEE